MAKIATLTDDFQDGIINASLWNTVGTVSETGGRAVITPTGTYSYLVADATYDVTASQIVARIANTTPTGISGTLASFFAIEDISGNQAGFRKQAANLECYKLISGVPTVVYTVAYNSSVHIFWRMRESAGIFYWDVSTAGTSWTNLFNTTVVTNLFPVNNVQFALYAGWLSGSEPVPGTFQIEAINPGQALTATGASTSTGSVTFRRIYSLASSGASTSSGTLSWTIPPLIAHSFAASGASTSDGALSYIKVAPGQITAAGASTSTGILVLSIVKSLSSSAASFATGTLAFTIYTPPPDPSTIQYFTFEPPIAYDLPPTLPDPRPRYINAHARWKGGQRRGRTVLKIAGTYSLVDTPTVDQTNSADAVYMGGHIYTVDQTEADALSAAGYTVTPIPTTADTTFPIITIHAPPSGAYVDQFMRVRLSVSETVAVTATLTGNGLTYPILVPSTSFTITTVDLSQGSYRLEFVATDLNNNSVTAYVDVNILHQEAATDDCIFPSDTLYPDDTLFPILCNEDLPTSPVPSLILLPSVTLLPGIP